MTTIAIKQLVNSYITTIWNEGTVEKITDFLHPDFTDHTLPPTLPDGIDGVLQWIALTNTSFKHRTIIEDQVTEENKSIILVRMEMEHIGLWRGITPTGATATTRGYRFFRIADGLIREQWAQIDGAALEAALTGAVHACKVPQLQDK